MNESILLVEDEEGLRMTLSDRLRSEGYAVDFAGDGDEGLSKATSLPFDLIILDIILPNHSGLNVCRDVRVAGLATPILLLTARDQISDKVIGLKLGADDYVTKPFGVRELVARIRAVVRRREVGRIAAQREAEQGLYRFGDWLLDRRLRCLTTASGDVVALTKGEYSLLLAFLEAPQRPLTREHLLQATRVHEDVFDRSIDVQILRLRRRLETNPRAPSIIQTERGVGYRFTLPVERLS